MKPLRGLTSICLTLLAITPSRAQTAAPSRAVAAPSYYSVLKRIDAFRSGRLKESAAEPTASGWTEFLDELTKELEAFSNAKNGAERGQALVRLSVQSNSLAQLGWEPTLEIHSALEAWLRPRLRLSAAERWLIDSVNALAGAPENQEQSKDWLAFVEKSLGDAIRSYESAKTVKEQREAVVKIREKLALLRKNTPWEPSNELTQAVSELHDIPNLDLAADAQSLAPQLARDVVETGPVYRRGYVSQVTAGPNEGFGLMYSDEGIAFFNRQLFHSYTPITDFQNQLRSDPKGRRVANLYEFSAASVNSPRLTISVLLRPNGVNIFSHYDHNVDAEIRSTPIPGLGRGIGRLGLAMLGMNGRKLTNRVYTEGIDKIRQNVVREAAEESAERIAVNEAEQNDRLREYLPGDGSAKFDDFTVAGLALRSRPEFALIGGTLGWREGPSQAGADAPQPFGFDNVEQGITADVHLVSILSNLAAGFLLNGQGKDAKNVVIIPRGDDPKTPEIEKPATATNLDYKSYLDKIAEARKSGDPKVQAIRVHKPSPPRFGADASGNLVALVNDLRIEVPAPIQIGIFGASPKVYRLEVPDAEFVLSVKVTPGSGDSPPRIQGVVENFHFGADAKVFGIVDDETKPAQLDRVRAALVLQGFVNGLKGNPIDAPLQSLGVSGFSIASVSPLDPSGWLRVVLSREQSQPGGSMTADVTTEAVTDAVEVSAIEVQGSAEE